LAKGSIRFEKKVESENQNKHFVLERVNSPGMFYYVLFLCFIQTLTHTNNTHTHTHTNTLTHTHTQHTNNTHDTKHTQTTLGITFGELSLLRSAPTTATILANSNLTQIYSISVKQLRNFISEPSDVATRFLEWLARTLAEEIAHWNQIKIGKVLISNFYQPSLAGLQLSFGEKLLIGREIEIEIER